MNAEPYRKWSTTRVLAEARWIIALGLLAAICDRDIKAAAEEAEEPASRTIKFALDDKPYVVDVSVDDPPKEDLRYAAVIRGFAPLLVSDFSMNQPPSTEPITLMDVRSLALTDSSASGLRLRRFTEPNRAGRHRFRAALLHDYEQRLEPPRGEHVSFRGFFQNGINQLRPGYFNLEGGFNPAREMAHPPLEEFAFFAHSVEEAKQVADDFLHCYDHGFLSALRKPVEERKAELIRARDEATPHVAELERELATAKAEAKDIERLDNATFSDLKVKRTLLTVELAGVKARVAAIEKRMKDLRPTLPANEQLNSKLVDLKVSADIDLASLAAQQTVLEELLGGQQKLSRIGQLSGQLAPYRHSIEKATTWLPRCDEILADLTPFALVDDTVQIRPIQFHIGPSDSPASAN
jgi:hypothetical protein